MKTVAKFYYNEEEFPKEKFSFEPIGQIVDTRFNDLVTSIPTLLTNYEVVDFTTLEKRPEKIRYFEILSFNGRENKDDLKNIFSSIFVNNFGIFPYEVSCKNKEDYTFIEEVFREKGIKKKLSSGILEKIFNSKLIL